MALSFFRLPSFARALIEALQVCVPCYICISILYIFIRPISRASTPTVAGAITSVSLVGGGREELRGAW